MKKRPPAYQMYAKDWNSSPTVARMDMHDKGVYITMLNAAWDFEIPGTLPSNLEITAKICRTQARTLRNFLDKFPSTFRVNGDFIINDKLHSNYLNYKQISKKRSKIASDRHKKDRAIAEQKHYPAPASSPASASAPKVIIPPPPTPSNGHAPKELLEWAGAAPALKLNQSSTERLWKKCRQIRPDCTAFDVCWACQTMINRITPAVTDPKGFCIAGAAELVGDARYWNSRHQSEGSR